MSEWQNVGARHSFTMSDIPTKKALKDAIVAKTVELYSTDAFGTGVGKMWFADKLEIGVKYTVVGPNPYTSRKWYATVEKLPNGSITVK